MHSLTTRTATAAFVVSQLFTGCAGSAPAAPSDASSSVPAVVLPPAPSESVLADATLSGMVYEVIDGQRRGIAGASVYCEPCGESTHNFTDTDSNGEYIFPHGVWTEGRVGFPTRVLVRKDGYGDPPGLPKNTPPNPSLPGWREVVINGDTRFEIEMVRR
jgi:hypothetical protein